MASASGGGGEKLQVSICSPACRLSADLFPSQPSYTPCAASDGPQVRAGEAASSSASRLC